MKTLNQFVDEHTKLNPMTGNMAFEIDDIFWDEYKHRVDLYRIYCNHAFKLLKLYEADRIRRDGVQDR